MQAEVKITPAQTKILQGIADGKLNKQIAADLGITTHVVDNQMTMAKKQNDCLSRYQLLLLAYSAGKITFQK